MTSKEILTKYLEFYQARGHKQIPNVSLIPEGDSTLLYVNSGMFPLVPYLSGEQHPFGKRLVNVQRALRFFEDLDNVGETNRHTTAFHMMGNWSLGDYFKKEQLPWAYQFFVEELGLAPSRLFATVFEGDAFAPKDEESIAIIKEVFLKYGIEAREGERIFACSRKDNWWQRGDAIGELGGPDSEVFYYLGQGSPKGKSPAENQDEFLEIGNSVFMQYKKSEEGWEELPAKNVDFGGGLERMAMVVQGKTDIFETDNFWPIIQEIEKITGKKYYDSEKTKKNMRVLADHMRASTFLAMDGVVPANKDQSYILRRLLRRMVRAGRVLGVEKDISVRLVPIVVNAFEWLYPQLPSKTQTIQNLFAVEEDKFFSTLKRASNILEKIISETQISGGKSLSTEELAEKAFTMYQSVGYPSEIFLAEVKDRDIAVNEKLFNATFEEIFNKHQDISRAGIDKKFKGGLADTGEINKRYHTATHLLQRALKNVLGDHVVQLGSNITADRLRFDFPHMLKLTVTEIAEVEKQVNAVVDAKKPVNFAMLPKDEAVKSGALYLKNETYPDTVKVYYVGDKLETAYSKEFCGGPHVINTSEIGKIEIFKQETIGGGKQRIYARFKSS